MFRLDVEIITYAATIIAGVISYHVVFNWVVLSVCYVITLCMLTVESPAYHIQYILSVNDLVEKAPVGMSDS